MLGEKIGDLRGRTTGQRVLPSEGGNPRVETSYEGTGKLLGLDCKEAGTYISEILPDGIMRGEGQGLLMGANGEVITWKGNGVGRPVGKGATQFRGVVYHETSAPKMSRINGICCVFEFDVDEAGAVVARLFEWK